MNKVIIFIFSASTLLFNSCEKKDTVSVQTTKMDSTGLNIVFIDLDTLLENYDLYLEKKGQLEEQSKSAEKALAGKIEAFQKRAQKFQAEVMEIQQKANTIAPVELKKLEEKFGKQQENLAKEEEALMKQRESVATELEKKLVDTQNDIQKNLDDYLAKIAEEKGYSLILKKGSLGGVMYGTPTLDITLETAKALNEEYKNTKK
ncbi:MAG: OmpH family outer membrane protein [Saprospiraceae bacterium]|nr:OmpH family outer membrane protein [Saprospiraceae bacterium]MBK7525237.1 OmpH family outer membrane protein [Saprospiraceae bacterium]MBK8546729.1 OmpH family outer membrane protein [Saprospiraceae bacterium]MBK8854796.1 OmpH family outer membrane protein [Saprospiraceae bacterium]MBK9044243.1 OmpH family outer membrane protein [Saprospiraceae bacterium]